MLQGLQVLRGARACVEPGPVAGGPVADQLHVRLRLGQLALDVLVCRARQREVSVHHGRLVLQLGHLLAFGQPSPRVGELVEPSIERLHLKQPGLPGGFG